MADEATKLLLPHLRRLVARQDGGGQADGQLVERFCRHGEEAAFAELVRRHGPMVLGVCRTILRHLHDAEDSFQATFLILARKAGTIRRPEAVASWLYRIASHVAAQAAARSAAWAHSTPALERTAMTAGDPLLDLTVRELRQALYEELGHLPEKYRAPLVLCYLEGRTQDEAAQELGRSKGALRGRLIRGREKLRARLTRRGLAPSAGVLALGLASAGAVPPTLQGDTVKAGQIFRNGTPTGVASAKAASLAEGALRALFLGRLKGGAVCLLLAGLLAATGALARQSWLPASPEQRGEPARQTSPPGQQARPKVRVDTRGDPLPEEAVSRLGTLRFRHASGAGLVRFTPDGKVVVSQGMDGVRTWAAATGKQLHAFPPETTSSWGGASLSPDGKLLATGSASGIHLWAVATGERIRTISADSTYLMVYFSPDGKHLVALRSSSDPRQMVSPDRQVVLLEATTGRQLWSWRPDKHPVHCVAFAPDGKTVLVAYPGLYVIPPRPDYAIHYLDAATGQERRRFDLGTDFPEQVAFSPDGSRLAVLVRAWNGKVFTSLIRMCEAAGGKELLRLDPPTREGSGRDKVFSALTFTPDGKSLLASCGEDALILFDVATGQVRRRLGRGMANSSELTIAPDGKLIAATSTGGGMQVVDWVTGEDRGPAVGNRWGIYWTALTPDSQTVVTAGAGPSFALWDPATGRLRRRLDTGGPLCDYYLADNGRTAFSLTLHDKVLHCWDLATGAERFRLPLDFVAGGPHVKAVGPGGKVLAIGTFDGDRVHLVEADTGKEVKSFQDPGRKVRRAAFSADGRTLVTFCSDRTAQLWDVACGEKRQRLGPMGSPGRGPGLPAPRLVGDNGPAYAAALSPDGTCIAYGSELGELLLFDVATGQKVRRLDKLSGGVSVLAFSPNGRVLAWGSGRDPVVHLLEVASGKKLRSLTGHRGSVCSLAFTADGKTLVSGSTDTTALVWDLTGRLAAAGAWDKPPASADLDAYWVALAGADAAAAFDAVQKLAVSPAQALPFLHDRLRPVRSADEKRLAGLIADLDSEQFQVRERAAQELAQLGDVAVAACRRALAGQTSPEVRRRLDALVEKQSQQRRTPSPITLRLLRAVEVLEAIGTPESRRLLEDLAGGAPEARLTQEARTTLNRMPRRQAAAP